MTVSNSRTWRRTSNLERPHQMPDASLPRCPLLRRVASAIVLSTVRRESLEISPKAGTQQHQVFRG